MKRKRFFCIRAALALILIFSLALPVFAQTEIRSDEEYTFTGEEFSEWEDLRGIFITGLSDGRFRLLLGNRVILPGDVIAGEDLARLRLRPVADEDAEASVRFLPICGEGLGEEAVFTMHVQKSSDEPPEARDMKLETYRNLPNSAVLRAKDDGDGPLTFQLKDKPTRGTVELSADGSFTYTPKKNKVGEDSFTYTVTDEAGNESAPATVRINILTPQDAETFADLDRDDQFTALWLRETGLFGGERVSDRLSFGPDLPVSRGEFLAMLMDLEGIDPEIGLQSSGFADEAEAPGWIRPYLGSAMRRGLAQGCRNDTGLYFRPNRPVTGAEAAVFLSRVLRLDAVQTAAFSDPAVPAWAVGAAAALQEAGIVLTADRSPLTRRQVADLLYAVSALQDQD